MGFVKEVIPIPVPSPSSCGIRSAFLHLALLACSSPAQSLSSITIPASSHRRFPDAGVATWQAISATHTEHRKSEVQIPSFAILDPIRVRGAKTLLEVDQTDPPPVAFPQTFKLCMYVSPAAQSQQPTGNNNIPRPFPKAAYKLSV